MHRAAGGFGGLRVNSRLLIPVPYPDPEDEYTVLIGDWYTKSHTILRKLLDSGRSLGRPEGVLINGKTAKGDGKDEPLFTMKPAKTYKYRICNVGLKNSLNYRIQGHSMKLVEMEGSHVVQNMYDSLDVHVGECFSVLVTADKEPKDYYMVASTRFTKTVLIGKGIIRYTNGKGPASPDIPPAPVGWAWSLNQSIPSVGISPLVPPGPTLRVPTNMVKSTLLVLSSSLTQLVSLTVSFVMPLMVSHMSIPKLHSS